MLIQIILTVIAAATASAMFAAGVRRPRWTRDCRPILAALAEDGDDVLPPDGQWQPVNQWESVLTSSGLESDEWIDLGGEG